MVCELLIVSKHEVVEGERFLFVFKAVRVNRLVVLDLKVALNRLGKLDQRQALLGEHVWLSNTNGIVPVVLTEAVHQVFELEVVVLLEQRHEAFDDLNEDGLLLLQDVDARILVQLKGILERVLLALSHPEVGLDL